MTIYFDRTPYTYLIGWTSLDKWYYGVRYAKGCHPDELWKSYFTSSKHVKAFVQEHGEPDVKQVRRTFDTVENARNWESKVLTRLGVVTGKTNSRWLNKTNNKSISSECCSKTREYLLGRPKSASHRENISTRLKALCADGSFNSPRMLGKTHSDETKKKMSEAHKGKEGPWRTKPCPWTGKPRSEETKAKIRATLLAKNK